MKRYWLIEKRAHLTQEKIALEIGISRSAYSNIESGHRDPSVVVAKKIANELQFDWTLFFKDVNAHSISQQQAI